MNPNILLLAIPGFLLLILLELALDYLRCKKTYSFQDTLTNLNIGIGNQVFNLFFKAGILTAYIGLRNAWAVWDPGVNPGAFLLCLLLFDFLFYWAHRWSHEINFWWGAHVVHHQSESYNLSVALRQSWFHNVLAFIIFLPLPLLGFDPVMFGIAAAVHTLYQFWIHTRHIGKLPRWIEFWLNTPSHHRVHHGVNPQYIDKNHGGMLILWDRIFGTFQAEAETPVYGITQPLRSWNPFWANIHYYIELWKKGRGMRLRDKLRLPFARPGWLPAYMGGTQPIPQPDPQAPAYTTPVSLRASLYVFVQFLLILGGLTALMGFFQQISLFYQVVFAALLLVSTMICGAILEQKPWVRTAEYLRLALIVASLDSFYYFWYAHWFSIVAIASAGVALLFLVWWTLDLLGVKPVWEKG